MRTPLERAAERWRYRLLLGLAAAMLLGQPLLQDRPFGATALAALFAVTVATTGLVARGASVPASLSLAAPAGWLALHLAARHLGGAWLDVLAFAAMLWLTAQTVWITVAALVRDGHSNLDALAGAVFGYFMLALAWAQLYAAALLVEPGAIAAPGDAVKGSDLIYFSLVTVTTLGYGDVLPVSPMARILAATEAVVGALYVAVLIGRIVADLKPGGEAG